MNKLITINESLHNAVWLYEALAYAVPGDSIVMIEDAVTNLQSRLLLASFLAKCAAQKVRVYALQEDMALRGTDLNVDGVELVSIRQLPTLVAQHRSHVAW